MKKPLSAASALIEFRVKSDDFLPFLVAKNVERA
jgi:hypothetical protein